MRQIILIAVASAALAVLCHSPATAQLRVVTYNTANGSFGGNDTSPRSGMDTVLQAIGDEVTNGFARPIDLLILQEQDEPNTTTQEFVDLLNGIYGANTYDRSLLQTGPFGSSIRQTLVYNTTTVSLEDEETFGNTSGSTNQERQTGRYRIRPVGYDSAADFHVFNSHYKAGSQSSDATQRQAEAVAIRNLADFIGEGAHLIYAGDYNMRASIEAAYQTLLSAGPGQAFDPIDTPGIWSNNSNLAITHTQSPHDGSDGLTQGGMDDRFDFQLVTGEFLDDEGLSYIAGSYHAFGNNGTTYNDPVNDNGNTYPLSQAVLDALAHVSDHLPVVADYQLPARMNVTTNSGSVPPIVINGATVEVDVDVENDAPVAVAIGADELDYTLSVTGDLTGGVSDTAQPLAAANSHTVTIDTSTGGIRSGDIDVDATSQGAANASFSEMVSTIVLDHANPSFTDPADTNTLAIDFGTVVQGSAVADLMGSIFNLAAPSGFTASLDLDSINGSGDTGVLTTDLSTFTGLAPVSGVEDFLASFSTATLGSFAATYTLAFSDEDLPGAIALGNLTLDLLGQVVIAGDFDFDGDVDLDDFNILASGFGTGTTLAQGDADGDGDVDLDDFNLLASNFGFGAGPESDPGALPEPSSALILLILAGGFARRTARVRDAA